MATSPRAHDERPADPVVPGPVLLVEKDGDEADVEPPTAKA